MDVFLGEAVDGCGAQEGGSEAWVFTIASLSSKLKHCPVKERERQVLDQGLEQKASL